MKDYTAFLLVFSLKLLCDKETSKVFKTVYGKKYYNA